MKPFQLILLLYCDRVIHLFVSVDVDEARALCCWLRATLSLVCLVLPGVPVTIILTILQLDSAALAFSGDA